MERKKQREGREKERQKKKKGSTTRHQADSEQAWHLAFRN